MDIKGRVFVVSGGASGLGKATVLKLAQSGAQVVIADLNEDRAQALAGELGGAALAVKADVSDEESVKSLFARALEKFKAVHGVISCAGVGFPEKTVNKEGVPHSLKGFKKTIEVNLYGSFNLARYGAAQMAKQELVNKEERGVIINTASVAAFEGQIGQLAYSASKGGIVGMTLPMARDLSPLGIRVMTIAPGIFDTPMLAGLPENVREALGKMVPFPSRLGHPEEYAQLACQIIENPMLNGTVIRLDGAIRLSPR